MSEKHAANLPALYLASLSAVTEYQQSNVHSLNGHGFNVKRATQVVWCKDHICTPIETGIVQMVSGQISHRLKWRPDDQIYYKIKYDDKGMPKEPEIEISRGGVSRWFNFIQSFTIIDLESITIAGIKVNSTSPLKALEEASTKLSHLTERKGWEAQVAALTYGIALAAINPYPDGTLLRDNNSNAVHIVGVRV